MVSAFVFAPHSLLSFQTSASANKLNSQKKNYVGLDPATTEDELALGSALSIGDANLQSNSDSASSPTAQMTSQTRQNMRDEWAATVIQTAFRAFLVLVLFLFGIYKWRI